MRSAKRLESRLAERLCEAAVRGETIAIRAAGVGSAFEIEIARGRLVAIDCDTGETLGDFLLRTGRVPPETMSAAKHQAEERGLPLIAALERRGVDPARIADARRDLYIERLVSALGSEPEPLPTAPADDSEGTDLLEVVVRALSRDETSADLIGYLVPPHYVLTAGPAYERVAALISAEGLAGRTVDDIVRDGPERVRALAVLLRSGAATAEPPAGSTHPSEGSSETAGAEAPDLLEGKGVALVALRETASADGGAPAASAARPPPPPRRAIGRISLMPAAPPGGPVLAVPEGPSYAPPTLGLDDPVTAIEDALGADPPPSDETRADLLLRKARLLWERFGEVEEAARTVREAAAAAPASLAIVREGTTAFLRMGDLASAVSFLRMELQLQTEPADRASVLRHLASVLERAGDRLGGQDALRVALDIDPDDTSAMRALASQSPPREAADLWARIARVRARGNDADDALCAVRQSLRLVPAHEGAIAVAVDVLLAGRRFAEAERMVRDVISAADAAGRVALYRHLTEIGRVSSRPALVAEACRQILVRAPDDATARRELHAALVSLGRTGDLVRFLRVEGRSEDPEVRVSALEAELALVRASTSGTAGPAPGDGELAVRVAAKILALRPEHADALATVRGELERLREYGTLCDVLYRSTAATTFSTPEALAQRLVEVATLAEDKLGAVHRAFAAWERAATLTPGPEVEAALSRLRGKVKLQDGLLELAERELTTAPPEARLPALRKVGGLVKDHPRMADRAVAAYREVLEKAPNDTAAMLALGRLYDTVADAEGMAWLLRQRLLASPHRGERVRILARLAEVLHEDLARLDEARATCLEILGLAGSHEDTLARLERIAVEAGDSGWLADALDRRAKASTGGDRADQLLALAALQQGPLADPAAATATLLQVLEARPDDWRALRALAKLHARSDETLSEARDTAVRLLGLPAGRSDGRTRAVLADVRVRLGDFVGARDALRALVALDPGDEASALALVELLLDDRSSTSEGDSAPGGRLLGEAAETIESLYRSDIEPQVLAHLTLRAVDLMVSIPDLRMRAELLVTRWLDRMDPRDSALARRAAESARERGDDAASARLLERALVGAAESERSDLLMLAAERWDAAGGLAAATRCRVRLLRVRPHDPAVLSALEQTYARVGDAARLIAVLEMRLAAAVHRDERHDAYGRLAAAARDLAGDPDRALAYLGRGAREAPGEARALDSIQGMLLKLGRHEELAAHLEARAEGAASATEQASFLRQAAFVRDRHLGDLTGAVRDAKNAVIVQLEASQQAHRAFAERNESGERGTAPTPLYDGDALQELEKVAVKARDVETMREVYDLLARSSTGAHGERAILYRGGRFFEQIGLPQDALGAYVRSFRLDPQSGAALRAIERIASDQADWEPLVAAYQVLAEAAPDPGTRASALRRAATAAEVGLLDRERALGLLLAAYASWGDPELEHEMRRVAREIAAESVEGGPAAFQRLKAALERRAASALDGEDRARWVQKLARIDEEDRGDPRGAFEALREACAASPEVLPLADDLERLGAKLGAWETLATTYDHIISESLDPALASEYRMRLARIDLAHLGGARAEKELQWLVAQRGPQAKVAFDLLRTRYEATSARAALAALLESTLPSLEGDERVQRTLETAEILDGDLSDAASALAVCEATRSAIGTCPPELRWTMLRLAEAAGDAGKHVALLQEELAATSDPATSLQSWLRIASLREKDLADPAGALEAYQHAIATRHGCRRSTAPSGPPGPLARRAPWRRSSPCAPRRPRARIEPKRSPGRPRWWPRMGGPRTRPGCTAHPSRSCSTTRSRPRSASSWRATGPERSSPRCWRTALLGPRTRQACAWSAHACWSSRWDVRPRPATNWSRCWKTSQRARMRCCCSWTSRAPWTTPLRLRTSPSERRRRWRTVARPPSCSAAPRPCWRLVATRRAPSVGSARRSRSTRATCSRCALWRSWPTGATTCPPCERCTPASPRPIRRSGPPIWGQLRAPLGSRETRSGRSSTWSDCAPRRPRMAPRPLSTRRSERAAVGWRAPRTGTRPSPRSAPPSRRPIPPLAR